MKFNFLIIVMLLSTSVLFSQNGRIEIHKGDSLSHYKLFYMSDMKSDVVITTLNPEGQKIDEYKTEDKQGFVFPINLSERPSGVYYIEVFTPLYTLYDTIHYKTEIDQLKQKIDGEIVGKKVILTASEPLGGEYRIVINENSRDIISDQRVKGTEFGIRVFDFNDSEAEVTNVSIYYKGNKVKTWSVRKDELDP